MTTPLNALWSHFAPAWLQRFRRTHSERAELRALPDDEFRRFEQETGLTAHDVERLQADHPGPGQLMPQRLQAAGIDPNYVREAEPAVFQDLQRTCTRCGSAKQCAHDLAVGDWEAGLESYCANAATIDALLVDRK